MKKKKNIIIIFFLTLFITILIILILVYLINIIIKNKIKYIYNKCNQIINIDKKKFINDVCKSIPFYKKYNIRSLPIVTKKYINNNQKLFLNENIEKIHSSVNSANNAWTEKKNIVNDISYYKFIIYLYGLFNNKAIAHVSGGSSGNYFYQWYTIDEYEKGLYGFFKSWINIGWKYNDRLLLYYFHGSNSIKLLNKINFIQNICSVCPNLDENGDISEKSLYEFIYYINNFKPVLIVSFPNIIFRISQLIYMKNIELKHIPKCMDLSADFLFTCQYKFICSIFKNCDIRLSYGTIEFGQIAQQIPNRMFDYIVFHDIVDVENDENNNLIITNYLFTTQPIIRYLTDDKGTIVNENGKIIIHNLIGKSNNMYDYIWLDNIINKCTYSIINLRINDHDKILIITILYENNANDIKKYFSNYFYKYIIETETCSKKKCDTNDRYDRKNTPIMNEFFYHKK
jgi:hypothetical protein